MSNSERIKRVSANVDDLVRNLSDEFVEEVAEDMQDEAPESIVLGDWVLVTHWIDPDKDTHWYHELRSPGLSPHGSLGLVRQALEQR